MKTPKVSQAVRDVAASAPPRCLCHTSRLLLHNWVTIGHKIPCESGVEFSECAHHADIKRMADISRPSISFIATTHLYFCSLKCYEFSCVYPTAILVFIHSVLLRRGNRSQEGNYLLST